MLISIKRLLGVAHMHMKKIRSPEMGSAASTSLHTCRVHVFKRSWMSCPFYVMRHGDPPEGSHVRQLPAVLGELWHCLLVDGLDMAGHTDAVLQRKALHARQRLEAELLPALQPQLDRDVRGEQHSDTWEDRRRHIQSWTLWLLSALLISALDKNICVMTNETKQKHEPRFMFVDCSSPGYVKGVRIFDIISKWASVLFIIWPEANQL